MRKFLKLVVLLFSSSASFSQSATIKGKISDTLEKKTLSNAVITLINKKDSVIFKFSRSNERGEFLIVNVTPGQYNLIVTYPRFASYTDQVDVKDNSIHDLGTVPLTQAAKLLENVIVRSGSSIRIKGDTTEFVADSFKVKEGATVEDLLKQLPGFQVDSKGNITTQGKRVDKVLVDGEEFFGDDPTMATQNIGARAVDKVQVYDTKTDQQAMTGIGSGNEGKTVNIKLKDEAKKGGFGKFYAATDFNKYHDAKAMYNRFIGKKKMSGYITKSTINTGSLNYQDQQRLGVENDLEYDEINGYYMMLGSSDGEFNDYNLRGLPGSYTAGALYNDKWSSDKQNLNSSYRYNRLTTENINSTLSQTFLPNGSIFNDRKVKTNALNQQHAINAKYEWKIDSFASIKYSGAGIYKTSESFSSTETFSSSDLSKLNSSVQDKDNKTERKQLDNQLTYRQQFKKQNRLLLLSVRYGHVEDDNIGMLNATTAFYFPNRPDSIVLLDQLKKFDGLSRTFGGKATFSEPLSLKWNVVLDYSFNNNNSTSNRNTFNKDPDGKYQERDLVFSNNFDLVAVSHTGNTIFRYLDKKIRLAFGSGLSAVQLRLHNLDNNNRNTYNFLNVTPQAQFSYTIKPQNTISLSYRGSTRQPRIDQLQPLRDNTDPLNIFQGNPDLKVGFNHTIGIGYNNYKVLKARYLYFSVSYNAAQNSITNYSIIKRGARTYMPVNTNGVNNWSIYSNWSQGEGNKKWRKYVQLSANGGRNINFTDTVARDFKYAQKAVNDYTNITLYTGIGYQNIDKYSFNIGPTIGYNTSGSSLQTANDLNYFSYGGRASGYIAFGKFEISSDVNVDYRQRLPIFSQNTNIIRWNGTVSRKVFKDNSGKIFLVANDILNQNKGWSRIVNSNIITDEQYLNISRYFQLKFEWTFNKTPGK
jgi:hypothetical protein